MPSTPNTELIEAIRHRNLGDAEEAAHRLERVQPEHALAIVLLMGDEGDARYDRALVRWLGVWLAEHPQVGLDVAAELLHALSELDGASRNVARSQAAFALRSAGSDGPASVLERW